MIDWTMMVGDSGWAVDRCDRAAGELAFHQIESEAARAQSTRQVQRPVARSGIVPIRCSRGCGCRKWGGPREGESIRILIVDD